MSFFQTLVLFFFATTLIAYGFRSVFGNRTSVTANMLYPALVVSIFVLVFWTLVQMIFELPELDSLFPVTAMFLGVLFSSGIEGAYFTLKNRKVKK